MYFDVALMNFVCLFQYFIFVSKMKSALFFFFLRELQQVHNGKYTEGVTGFTQFHKYNIYFSLTYIFNEWLVLFIILAATQKFFTDECGKNVSYGYFKGLIFTITSPLIKEN